MTEQGTYSYRDGEYRRNGEPIDVLTELCELYGGLAAAEARLAQESELLEGREADVTNRDCKIDDLQQRLTEDWSSNYDLRQLLETACDAWECGIGHADPANGILLYRAAGLPAAWYEAAKKATGGE